MKNISFDDSTVLREFARLSVEKGLIKEAAAPAAPSAEMPSTKVHTFDDQLLAFPLLNNLNKGQRITDGSALLKELGSAEFKRFKDGWTMSNDMDGKNKLNALMAKVLPLVKQLQAQVKKMSPQHQQAYTPVIESTLALLSRAEKEDVDNVKTAASEKLYDVSGETGKDLVDSAHPGGGTATELTHSKTKENLVETIVEQQEADLEVVRKVPKGTYAVLMGLYNQLTKLGLEDKLANLKEDIISIATDEDVIEHTLITLADDLDKLGYSKYANGVDGLLKKKIIVANDVESLKIVIDKLDKAAGDLFLNQLIENLKTAPINDVMKANYTKALQFLKGKGMVEANKAIKNIFIKDTSARGAINKALSHPSLVELVNRKDVLRNELKQLTAPQVVPPREEDIKVMPAGKAGKKPAAFSKRVLEFQKLFNQKSTGTKLVEDGIWGPKTKEVWDFIGGFEGLAQKPAQSPAQNQEQPEQVITQQPSPFQGLENAKKIDIEQMDMQRLAPQVYSMVLRNYNLTQEQLGKDNILDLAKTIRSYIDRATKEVYNTGMTFKDQVSRDKQIRDLAYTTFIKEVPKEALLSK